MSVPERQPEDLFGLVKAYRLSRALYAVAEAAVPDALVDGPLSPAAIAERTGCHADTLHRVMRYLAAEGIFSADDDGRYGLLPISREMLSTPGSGRAMLLGWVGLPLAYSAYGELHRALRGEGAAFELAHGAHFHDYLAAHPAEATAYGEAMESTVEGFDDATAAYDFSTLGTVVDVGGGAGSLLISLLRRYPHLRGVLYEVPHVADVARARLSANPEGPQLDVRSGDMFDAVPAGGDAYVFSTVLRCFADDACVAVLRNVRSVMSPDARVLALEMVLENGPAPPKARADLDALVIYGGRDRTRSEWEALLRRTDLRLSRLIPIDEQYSWVEAVAAD